MKQLILLLAIAYFIPTSRAQVGGTVINDPNVEIRAVSGFHAIMVEDGIDLYLSQGSVESVAISANKEEYKARMVTAVVDGVLKIYFKNNGVVIGTNLKRLRAYVSVKEIDEIKAYGGSDIIVKGALMAKKLNIQANGGSDFVGTIDVAEELSVEANGGSDVTLKGKATNLKIVANGGSDFWGFDLETNYAVVEANGGSDAQVNVKKEMYAEARGGSDILYKGDPAMSHSSASGGGSIIRK